MNRFPDMHGISHSRDLDFLEESLPVELEILRVCACSNILERRGPSLFRRLEETPPDWERVFRLACRHGLMPLLCWNLKAHPGNPIPQETMLGLRSKFLLNVKLVLASTRQLLDILEAFEKEKITIVPYKGPALSQQIYDNFALRMSVDLDLVVGMEDLSRARQLLMGLGYRPRGPLGPLDRRFAKRTSYSEEFVRPGATPVELHWKFTNGDIGLSVSLEHLENFLGTMTLGSRRIAKFSEEDLLLLLSVHGAKHRWARLEWIFGITRLIRSTKDLNWEGLISRARDWRVERMLLLGLFLARRYGEAPVPDWVVREATQCPKMSELIQEVHTLLLLDRYITESAESTGSLKHDLFHFHLRDRPKDQLRYVLHRLTTPSRPDEWKIVNVMGRPVPVHVLTRPIQLLPRILPATWAYIKGGGYR